MAVPFSWWDQNSAKILAGVAIAVILGVGSWLIAVDRNTVKTNFLLEQIGRDIGELRSGLKEVSRMEGQLRDTRHELETMQKQLTSIEARLRELEQRRR